MKKIIYVLFTTLLLLVAIWGLNIFKELKMNKLLYENTTSITVTFQESKVHSQEYVEYFKKIAKEHDVSISRYMYKNGSNLVVYTTDVSLNKQVDLKKGMFPKEYSRDFISTFDVNNKKQVGVMKQIDPKMEITIKYLDEYKNFSGNGVYYISTQNSEIITSILNSINKDVAHAEVYAENNSSTFNFDIFQIICIILVVLCIYIAIMHYLIDRLKELSIMRILGYTLQSIAINFFLKLTKIMLISGFTSYLLFSFYYTFYNGLDYYLDLTIWLWIITFILILIVTIPILFIVMFVFIKSINVSKIKGEKPYKLVIFLNYSLKCIFIVFLLFSINNWNQIQNELDQKLANLSLWNKTKNIYSTKVTFNGENNREIEYKTSQAMKEFYLNMENEHKGFMIDASNYSIINGEYIYNLNTEGKDAELSPSGKSITINSNYLYYNPIQLSSGKIEEKIIRDSNVMNILVPKKFKKYKNRIENGYRKHFYFQKVEVDNIYNQEFNKPVNTTKEQDLLINIIYTENNQNYFTYNPIIEKENKNMIKDPIAIVDTGNFHSSYYLSYVSKFFYFESTDNDPYSFILPVINKSDAEASIQRIDSLYDKHGQEIQNLKGEKEKLIVFIIMLIVANVVITYNTVSSYYQKNKLELYVKKVFGYSSVERNKIMICLLLSINVIPMVIMYFYFGNVIFLSGICIIALELLTSYIFDKKLSHKTFNSIIKGEH
ncbi:DUF1430 domain-containing protein [Bacillus cereus]|uniref:DUF1430 domain-containing protein n=1 Tax=Bacillus cereus TaxID=1396 RepID=UPI0018F33163|nr:DUF1430 domain-containing protein [Bacillus cereus]MBJ8056096.1 DUF1430 domain-containing protein [Bacillus cereus]